MTRRKKIVVSLAIVIVALLFVLELVLRFGLTDILRKHALPPASDAMGVNIDVKKATASFFAGKAQVTALTVGNPKGFTEPTFLSTENCFVDLALLSYLRGVSRLYEMRADNTKLTIVRNKDGKVNALEIQKTLARPDGARDNRLPNLTVDNLAADMLLEYIDHGLLKETFRLGFKISINMQNFTTLEGRDDQWGSFSIQGHLDNDPKACVISLKGEIAPLTNPIKPSFKLKGNILAIDLTRMESLKKALPVISDSATLETELHCQNGAYVAPSAITVKFKNARLTDPTARTKGVPLLDFSLTLPIRGTFESPKPDDWKEALSRTLTDNATDNLDAALQLIMAGKDDTRKALDKIKKLTDIFK